MASAIKHMHELHEYEQYFFDQPTLDHLAGFLAQWAKPCCICAPLLGKQLAAQGVDVRILDIDARFATVKGFCHFNIYQPTGLGEQYDIILCDPPFFRVSLSQLFTALRLLGQNDFSQKLLVAYLKWREGAILGTFAKFGLQPTGYLPHYLTVQPNEKNIIEFYGNLPPSNLARLTSG